MWVGNAVLAVIIVDSDSACNDTLVKSSGEVGASFPRVSPKYDVT